MEQWNKGNKMIQKIGDKEDPFAYMDMVEERLRTMEILGAKHISWFTHKNPYGCWICDMFLLEQRLIDSFREFLGDTSADVMLEGKPSKGESNEQDGNEDEEDAGASEDEEL